MLNWINKKRNKKGFTLIELVIVIAILGILIAIAVPRLSGFRDTAAERADEASKETIIKAAELYVATYDVDNIEESFNGKKYAQWPDALIKMLDMEDGKAQQGGEFVLKYSTTTGFDVDIEPEPETDK